MAQFQCRPCGYDGHSTWAGDLVCPRCGGNEGVRAAIATEEMTAREMEWLDQVVAKGQDDQHKI